MVNLTTWGIFNKVFWFTHDDLKKYLPNFSKLNGVQNKVRLVWYCPEFSVGPHQFQITRWLTFNAQLLLISPLSPPQSKSWWSTSQKWWLASWLKLLAPSEGDGPWPANHWITMVTRGREGVTSCWNLWMNLWGYNGVNSNLSAPSLTRGLWNSLPGRLWIEAQHCSQ